jgi:hypothetical protein
MCTDAQLGGIKENSSATSYVGATFVATVIVTTAGVMPAQAGEETPDASWVKVISADIDQRNAKSLVPSAAKLFKAPQLAATPSRLAAISAEATGLREQQAWFSTHGDAFSSFSTTVTLLSSKVDDGVATVRFNETTVMKRVPLADGTALPDYGYAAEQTATIRQDGGTWKVDSISHAQKEAATTMFSPELVDAIKSGALEPEYKAWETQLDTPKSSRGQQVTLASADKWSIANYAATYWSSYNPAYQTQSNDCTNFVSQALRAGGWADTAHVDPDNVGSWYYVGSNGAFIYPWSKSWINAQALASYGTATGRATLITDAYYLTGDIAFFDWDTSDSDNTMDHAAIITKVVGYEPYFTYHTSNRYNISFTQVRANAVANGSTAYEFNVGLYAFHV